MGRPPIYKDTFPEQARRLCLLGATNEGLAEAFGVAKPTIDLWLAERPEFKEQVLEGRERADAKVAESLFNRAIGIKRNVTKVFMFQGQIITKDIVEEVPPEVMAQMYWLNNRAKINWKVRQKDDDPGENTVKIIIEGGLPDDA